MSGARSILIIEDDASISSVVQLTLELENYEVHCAGNGQEALDWIAREGLPKLILLDMRMPVMDGWQFATALRDTYGNSVPVVVMTAAGDCQARAESVQADACLGKPFDVLSLQNTVKGFFRQAV